jgi:phosphoribosylaminoimidazole (AIR) synthetase
MSTLLIHQAHCIATQDDAQTELQGASLLIRDGIIERIAPQGQANDDLRAQADEVIDARHHVVLPGLVNTHHHMVQSLTRAVPGVQNAELFSWLQQTAQIDDTEMNRTFNNGIGIVVVVDAAEAEACAATLRGLGEAVYTIGRIAPQGDGAQVVVA